MKILKTYFISNNKMILVAPITLFCVAFYWHYAMVMGYQEELFKYTNETVRNEVLADEFGLYKNNLINNSLVYVLQIIGIALSLNIGLLFLGYKPNLKTIFTIVVKASIILVFVYIITPIVLMFKENVYSFYDLYKLETYNTLAVFADELTNNALKNSLEVFSLTQLIFVFVLALGVKHAMHWGYKKALKQTFKIYSLALVLWTCFALVMDLNVFNQ